MKKFTNSCFAVIASLLMLSCADHLSSHEDAQPVSLSAKLEASTLDRVQEIALAAPAQFPSYNATKAKEKKIAEIVPISTTKWAKDAKEMNDAQELLTEAIDDIYIVNYADNDGYAIVSTNKYMPEVLALIDSGNYKEEAEVPGGFEIFMERLPFYAMQQLKEAEPKVVTRSGNVPDTIPDPDGYVRLNFREETVEVDGGYRSSGTQISTKWGQDNPYNNFCPWIDTFDPITMWPVQYQALTGCVPVAIGQVAAYHRYPSSFLYQGIQVTLNWQQISNVASISSLNSNDRDAVAKFLHYLGVTSYVDYPNRSFTYPINTLTALSAIGFSSSSLLTYDFTQLFSSISTYGPALVGGLQSNGNGGHVWVVDYCYYNTYRYYRVADLYDEYLNYCGEEIQEERYFTNNYVHCNWGLCGDHDGFFSSGVFTYNENNVAISYDTDIKMIINITH